MSSDPMLDRMSPGRRLVFAREQLVLALDALDKADIPESGWVDEAAGYIEGARAAVERLGVYTRREPGA